MNKLLEELSVPLSICFEEKKLNPNLDKCHLIVSGTEILKIKLNELAITNYEKKKITSHYFRLLFQCQIGKLK